MTNILDTAPRDVNAVVYSRDNCPFCDKALLVLADNGFDVRVHKVNVELSRDELLALIKAKTGNVITTVPQIFIEGRYIGGHDDLVAHLALTTELDNNENGWFDDVEL